MIGNEHNGLRWLEFAGFKGLPVKHGIFTRHGGVSKAPFAALNLGGNVGDDPAAVAENHQRMYAALGLNRDRGCTVWQVHSADVLLVSGPASNRRWLTYADAMVTDRADTPLAMRFADCTPILLVDPVQGVIGIAHAGWRGTVAGVASAAVAAMVRAYGCRVENIRAGIGPSIGPDQYQVGDDVVTAVRDHFGPDAEPELIQRRSDDGTAYFNLWRANELDLRRAGVSEIEIAGICTWTDNADWFSHRKERGQTGRFGALISL